MPYETMRNLLKAAIGILNDSNLKHDDEEAYYFLKDRVVEMHKFLDEKREDKL